MLNRFLSVCIWVFLVASTALAAPENLVYHEHVLTFQRYDLPVRTPQGLRLELLATGLDQPRMLTFVGNGDLLVGSRTGAVYRLAPPYRRAHVLVQLGHYPHSVAWRTGELLIAQTDGLYRAPYELGQAQLDPRAISLLAALPGGRGHDSRTVRLGAGNKVYLSLGISGNCSDQYLGPGYEFADWRGGVMVLDEQSTPPRWQPFASGLRNPIGFDWQPLTGIIYASNNGPDHWGHDLPPEYFSRLTQGSFHGMPWFQFDGNTIRRDDCISREPPRPQTEVTPPAATFPARSAPMGVAFVSAGALDERFTGDAIVALHGSWATLPDSSGAGAPASRREPKLVVVRFVNGAASRVDDLITGFQLSDGRRWARPTGVAIGPDGALYFASDAGINGVFRLRRTNPASD